MYMMSQRLASNLSGIVVTHVREEEWVSGAYAGMNGMYIFHQENAGV